MPNDPPVFVEPALPPPGPVAFERPAVRVAVFGLADRLRRVVEGVFRDAGPNPYRFVLANSRGPADFDLAMVDMTVKGGPAVAGALRRLPDRRPVVTVGRRADPTRARDDLLLQRFAANLMTVLNGAVERRLGGSAQRGVAALVRGAAARLGHPDAERLLGRRPRVLLVDPSPAVRRQLALALHQMGLDSEGVGSAREALDVMAVRRYELVFVETVLPDLGGLQLTRDIKRDPALRGLPVIVLTRRSGPLDLVRGAFAGCDSYLVKPVSLPTLRQTTTRCLRKAMAALAREGAAQPVT